MIYYIIIINMIGLLSMGIDKRRAIHHQYRISEKMLFMIAIVGGSLGSWIGMYVFHHKTKHWYFVIGMPLLLIIQIFSIVFVYV